MMGCSICREIPAENEPRLARFVQGGVESMLCGGCDGKLQKATHPVIRELTERALREDARALAEQTNAREAAELEAECAALGDGVKEALRQVEELRVRHRQVRRLREIRKANAKRFQKRLVVRGFSVDVARQKASEKYRLPVEQLAGKERAA